MRTFNSKVVCVEGEAMKEWGKIADPSSRGLEDIEINVIGGLSSHMLFRRVRSTNYPHLLMAFKNYA